MTIINKVSNRTLMPGITPIPDVVDAPTIGTATAGLEQATVPFTAVATGGTATSFTAISTPGSVTASSATSPITVTGLTADTSYTFKVYGANSSGTWTNVQSSASNSVTPTGTSYASIATVTVGAGGSSSISFSSIPSTFKHLQVRALIKSTASSGPYYAWGRFNSDTGSNYAQHAVLGTGSAASTDNGTSISYFNASIMPDSTAASVFGGFVLDVLDYTNTNKYKTIRSLNGYDSNNTLGRIYFHSGLWQSTSAVSSITILPQTGATNFAQYSSFALYGIKG